MAKLVVQLSGGLGNQMFQYAAARAFALRAQSELVLDTWSGFVRDTQYRRQYELDSLPVQARPAKPVERVPFWMERLAMKYAGFPSGGIASRIYGMSVYETKLEFMPGVFELRSRRNCWMSGYWQSSRYFSGCERIMRMELMPPPPAEGRFLDLGRKMRALNSVALGVRLYEESTSPEAHARDGRLKPIESINQAIRALVEREPSCHFFVFCTHRSPALSQLNLPGDVTMLTHDDGYEGTLQRLWLLAQCRHHIMTNSSYYWWGAWLSGHAYSAGEQVVYAADNFINKDSIPSQWIAF